MDNETPKTPMFKMIPVTRGADVRTKTPYQSLNIRFVEDERFHAQQGQYRDIATLAFETKMANGAYMGMKLARMVINLTDGTLFVSMPSIQYNGNNGNRSIRVAYFTGNDELVKEAQEELNAAAMHTLDQLCAVTKLNIANIYGDPVVLYPHIGREAARATWAQMRGIKIEVGDSPKPTRQVISENDDIYQAQGEVE